MKGVTINRRGWKVRPTLMVSLTGLLHRRCVVGLRSQPFHASVAITITMTFLGFGRNKNHLVAMEKDSNHGNGPVFGPCSGTEPFLHCPC